MLADRVILACTVIIAVVYLYASTQIPMLEIGDPLGPKAFPQLLGIALLIACAFLAWEILRARHVQPAPEEATEPKFEGRVIRVLLVIVAWTSVFYMVFESLGFIVATALYLLPMMFWFNRGRWMANVLSAVLFAVGTYFLFVKLEVRLPQGILPF